MTLPYGLPTSSSKQQQCVDYSVLAHHLCRWVVPAEGDGSQCRHQPSAVAKAILRISFALTLVNALFWSTQWSTQTTSHRSLSFLVQERCAFEWLIRKSINTSKCLIWVLFRISIRTLSWTPNCHPMHGPWGVCTYYDVGVLHGWGVGDSYAVLFKNYTLAIG